jgi:hypothetical protein
MGERMTKNLQRLVMLITAISLIVIGLVQIAHQYLTEIHIYSEQIAGCVQNSEMCKFLRQPASGGDASLSGVSVHTHYVGVEIIIIGALMQMALLFGWGRPRQEGAGTSSEDNSAESRRQRG